MAHFEENLTPSGHWSQRVGSQRDWVWRGWQIRYTYIRRLGPGNNPETKAEAERLEGPSTPRPPIILLHGFGASIGHWRHNLAVLGQYHTVYGLDLLGFGASQKASTTYSVDLWVQQVYDFWQTFIREPAILVGNSIGSLICLAAASHHPRMTEGVVMISLPDPAVRTEAIPPWLQRPVATVEGLFTHPLLLRSLFYLVRRPSLIRRWVKLAYASSEAITEELVEILSGPAYDQGAARAFCSLFKAVGSAEFGPGVKAIMPTLNIPLLLIWGKQDQMIPPRFARPHHFLDYNPRLKLIELEQAGHCPHDECPDRVNQAILDWIAAGKSEFND